MAVKQQYNPYNNDQVPDKWKNLFTNDEWYMHDIVVKSFMEVAAPWYNRLARPSETIYFDFWRNDEQPNR